MSKIIKITSALLIVSMISEILFPLSLYALTNGPGQPDFSSFEPVTTTGMVNEFTGDFTYNIPLMEVPGPNGSSFPFSLSYHSGSNLEQDASWVGYGWNLNPGSIVRSTRGNPDDDADVEVIQHTAEKPLETVTAQFNGTAEVASTKIPASLGGFLRYSTNKGWSVGATFDLNFAGYASLNCTIDDGNVNFSGSLHPQGSRYKESAVPLRRGIQTDLEDMMDKPQEVQQDFTKKDNRDNVGQDKSYYIGKSYKNGKSEVGNGEKRRDRFVELNTREEAQSNFMFDAATYYGKYLLNLSLPSQSSGDYTGENISIRIGSTGSISTIIGPVGASGYIRGAYSRFSPNITKKVRSYGYLYSALANSEDALMDYTKEKNTPHLDRKKILPIPISLPDMYSVSGEGVNGAFRFHHNKVGTYKTVKSVGDRKLNDNGFEITAGGNLEIGYKFQAGYQRSELKNLSDVGSFSNPQKSGQILPYKKGNTVTIPTDNTELVEARFLNDLGGKVVFDQDLSLSQSTLLKPKLFDEYYNSPQNLEKNIKSSIKESEVVPKQSSFIDFNTIKTMKKSITRSYTRDDITRGLLGLNFQVQDPKNYLNDDAIGEFAVHKDNGQTYVYGLPVLSRNEESNIYHNPGFGYMGEQYVNDGRAMAAGQHRNTPYATTYLITQVLSPDYIDVDNNGPSKDDIGGWVKFNYRRSTVNYGTGTTNDANTWYQWRMPYGGKKNDPNKISTEDDDYSTVMFGEKQVYYLESIETKTHCTYFITNKTIIKSENGQILERGTMLERADAYEFYRKNTLIPNRPINHVILEKYDDNGNMKLWPFQEDKPQRKSFAPLNPQYIQFYELNKSTDFNVPNFSQYLERIVLYKKSDLETQAMLANPTPKPIKTVNLEYDYEIYGVHEANTVYGENCAQRFLDGQTSEGLGFSFRSWQPCFYQPQPFLSNTIVYAIPGGVWNSASYVINEGIPPQVPSLRLFRRMGKLTLRKVWFEYEGVKEAKISPYEFEYKYPNTQFNDSRLSAKYPCSFSIKAWDNNSVITQTSNIVNSLLNYGADYYQTPYYDPDHRGPWGNFSENLLESLRAKQYNRDYYVSQSPILYRPVNFQGELLDPASWQLKVIKLPSGGEIRVHYENHDYSYVQDRPAMAMVPISSYNSSLQEYELNVEKGLGLIENNDKQRLVNKINAVLKDKERIAFNFTVAFNTPVGNEWQKPVYNDKIEEIGGYSELEKAFLDNGKVKIKLKTSSYTPDDLFDEFYENNILGIAHNPLFGKGTDYGDIVRSIVDDNINFFNYSSISKQYYKNFSYFRVPLTNPKRGGEGVRVKRVLMYNRSTVGTGEESLYGKEYIYRRIDTEGSIISSGVATNEPSEIRNENPLVKMIDGFEKEKLFGVTIGGETSQQMEGPLGESLLQSPSVGYSRVIVRDIHKGSTNTGITVTDYYTAKDFPFLQGVDYTNVDDEMPIPPISIPFPFAISNYETYKSQGYRFIINNMHGQIKKVGKYLYNTNGISDEGIVDDNNWTQMEFIEYEYFKPGELLPLFTSLNEPLQYGLNGVESEIVLNTTLNQDIVISAQCEVDVGISLPLAVTASIGDIGGATSRTILGTKVASKIINYPAVLKKTTAYQNGMTVITENLAFSPASGRAVVTSVTDEYHGIKVGQNSPRNGTIVNYSIPAHFYYPQMGQMATNQKRIVSTTPVNVFSGSVSGTFDTDLLSEGDILEFTSNNPDVIPSYGVLLQKTPNVQIGQVNGATPLASGSFARVTVVQSGRTNQLSEQALNVSLYGISTDIVKGFSLNQIISNINSGVYANAGVISSSAMTYSDTWTQGSSPSAFPYLAGEKGKWRAQGSYVFLSETETTGAVYEKRGLIKGNFELLNFSSPASSVINWKKTTQIEKYSNAGVPLVEKDITSKYSTAIYAHNDIVPSIVAYDALPEELYFQSFEESGSGGTTTKSHTGYNSLLINGSSYSTGTTLPVQGNLSDYIIMFWTTSTNVPNVSGGLPGGAMEKVARNGEWILYKQVISLAPTHQGILINNFSTNCYLDDIRIQPVRSKTSTFVYDDRNLRLLAQFDDQHFASLYQYSGEGKLIRKLKETERGTKTLVETQYHNITKRRVKGKYDGSRYEVNP